MLILLCWAWCVNAQTPARQKQGLSDLIQRTLEQNLEIQAAKERWRASRYLPRQASSFPDPILSYARWLSSVETRVGPQENVFSLSQRIPFPGKLRLKGEIAGEEAAIERLRYEIVQRDVVFKLKNAFFDLHWTDRSLEILDNYQALLRGFTRAAEQRYATGQGIQANVIKSQVELSSIAEKKLGFAKMRIGAMARLNALLNNPADFPIETSSQLDSIRSNLPDSTIIQTALANRQELIIAHTMILKSELGVALARKEYLPDFNLQGAYTTIPSGLTAAEDDGKDPFSLMIGVNLPIWRGKRKANVNEARARQTANELSYENLKNGVIAEITDLNFQIKTTRETLDLYEQGLITQAETSLQSALAAYQTGKLEFLTLLDAERALLQFKLSHVRELASCHKQIAALERAVGGVNIFEARHSK